MVAMTGEMRARTQHKKKLQDPKLSYIRGIAVNIFLSWSTYSSEWILWHFQKMKYNFWSLVYNLIKYVREVLLPLEKVESVQKHNSYEFRNVSVS
jgi:hypothetical protein